MITVETRYVPSPDGVVPALAVQVVSMVDSYMVWIGATELGPDAVVRAPAQGRLARDWACAMPEVSIHRNAVFQRVRP